jgi:hypothetical protein
MSVRNIPSNMCTNLQWRVDVDRRTSPFRTSSQSHFPRAKAMAACADTCNAQGSADVAAGPSELLQLVDLLAHLPGKSFHFRGRKLRGAEGITDLLIRNLGQIAGDPLRMLAGMCVKRQKSM